MNFKHLIVDRRSSFIILTIHRPESLNALNGEVITELEELFTAGLLSPSIRSVIITGSGDKAFVAGADIREFEFDSAEKSELLAKRGQDLFRKIESLRIPVIAAVNGFALGGGCELSMACHFRIASEKAVFGQPEINLGLIPGYGGSQRLTRIIGPTKALELLMTGRLIDAREALQLGLVNEVVEHENTVKRAEELAELLSTKAPLAVEQVINCCNAYFDHRDGYSTESTAFGSLMTTADAREGVKAFLEKRKPKFAGK